MQMTALLIWVDFGKQNNMGHPSRGLFQEMKRRNVILSILLSLTVALIPWTVVS